MAKQHGRDKDSGEANLGSMIKSLGGFLGLISDLAEKGEQISRSGELADDKSGARAVYGFTVRLGGGGTGPRVEPFGNVKVGARGAAVVEESREPMVDVFDEEDHVAIVAELPGVEAKDVRFAVEGDVLELTATHGERKYRKEVLLPGAVDVGAARSTYHNGVFELRLPKVP